MVQGPVLLEYKYKAGDIIKYSSKAVSAQEVRQVGNSQKQDSKFEMKLRQEVVDFVDEVYRLETFVEEANLVQNGVERDMPALSKPNVLRLKKTGEIVSDNPQQQASQQTFPDHPINIGDKWSLSTKVNFPGRAEPAIINYIYTFEAYEKAKGLDCIRIKVESPHSSFGIQPGITQEFNINGFIHFAYNEGILVTSQIKTQSMLKTPQMQVNAMNETTMYLLEFNGKQFAD